MSLLRLGLPLQGWRHHRRFEAACRDPQAAQAAVLRSLLAAQAATAFGREHGFGRLDGPAAFRRAVPVRDYEGFRPYVDRQVAGEPNVLTAEPPEMFTTTSGTTGAPKLIPVPLAWRRQMTGLLRLWMYGALLDHPRCFDGRVLTVVSPAVEGLTPSGVPYGAMSGLTNQRAPWLVRRQYCAPYEASLVKDYEARYFLLLRLALAHDVSAIVTPNPSTLVRLAQVAARHADALVKALFDGTLGMPWPETLAQPGLDERVVQSRIAQSLFAAPGRARAIARQVERDGTLLPRHVWPSLQLIGCWLGGSAGQQARNLPEAYGEGVALRDVGLLASEGRMTVPMADGTAAGPLYVHANYYEFIPEWAIDEPDPPVLGAHELEAGQRYYLLLTGGNGLYRYDLNDVVEVRGFHHATPEVAFVRKGRDMLSITGEKLHLNHLQHGLRAAEAATGLDVWQYRLIPDVARSGYDLLVEWRAKPSVDRLLAFQRAVDAAIAEVNEEYASKRASGRLAAPRLHLMAPGWSERLMAAAMAAGKRDAQFKWPTMAHSWDEASRQEVLAVLGPDGTLEQSA